MADNLDATVSRFIFERENAPRLAGVALNKIADTMHRFSKRELGSLLVFLDGTPTNFLYEYAEREWQRCYPGEQLDDQGRAIHGAKLLAEDELSNTELTSIECGFPFGDAE